MKHLSTFIFSLFVSVSLKAQVEFTPHVIRIITDDPNLIPWEGRASNDSLFQELLTQRNVFHITRPMTFAKTLALQNCFELFTNQSVDSLFQSLLYYSRQNQNVLSTVEYVPKIKYLAEPSDYFWHATGNITDDWMWYLKKIQADLAWDITKGDTSVKVAVIDSRIDPNHPELIGKIDPPYDFYSGLPFETDHNKYHGASVATLIAAETKSMGEIANGSMP